MKKHLTDYEDSKTTKMDAMPIPLILLTNEILKKIITKKPSANKIGLQTDSECSIGSTMRWMLILVTCFYIIIRCQSIGSVH